MTIEEKAKRYDEAIEIARALNSGKHIDTSSGTTVCECIFPEIKDSEDEKIRKEIIDIIKSQKEQQCHIDSTIYDKMLTWLEKQDKEVDVIENFDTEFEKQVSRLLASIINKDWEYTEGFVKWASNSLLGYAKHEIEKQGEQKPTIKNSTDEDKVMKELLYNFIVVNENTLPSDEIFSVYGKTKEDILACLQKQGEQKSNLYSGVSFEYNSHTWGMCARDGGVEIVYDKQLIANINPIRENNEFDDCIKVINNKLTGCNTGDFITGIPSNHGI